MAVNFFAKAPYSSFLTSNFEVVESNVSSFDKAEVILCGCDARYKAHAAKFSWLVGMFAKLNRDIILIEGQEGHLGKLSLEANCEVRGWDSRAEWRKDNRDFQIWKKAISLIEVCDPHLDSPSKLKETVEKISRLINQKDFAKNIERAKEYFHLFNDKEKESFEILLEANEGVQYLAGKVKSASADKVSELFSLFVLRFIPFHLRYSHVVLNVIWMANRDISMVKNIDAAYSRNKRIFLEAGKGHLIYNPKWKAAHRKVGANIIHQGLKGKKYVILSPTDSEVNTFVKKRKTPSLYQKISARLSDIHPLEAFKNWRAGKIYTAEDLNELVDRTFDIYHRIKGKAA